MRFDDVVVLVPGFLGFSRLGGFYYFAERVVATLRGALEAMTGRTIPVIPVSALPTDHLANRQRWLANSLTGLCERMGGVGRLHLVGHSAGGVDAQLLTCARPLVHKHWSIDAERMRARITTVVGIAAPHHGTCLSNAPLAKLLADPLKQLSSSPIEQVAVLPSLARQLVDLWGLASSESSVLYTPALSRLQDILRFVTAVARHRGLIDDLAPRAMAATRRHWGKGEVMLRSFVTVAPLSPTADPFFHDLYRLTSTITGAPSSELLTRAMVLLRERAASAICSSKDIPVFDELANDGVVNSARQLVDPDDPDELAGIVVADHADVLGHYDREDMFMDGAPLNLGLFHSGAGFTDNEFYTLYHRVAAILAARMR